MSLVSNSSASGGRIISSASGRRATDVLWTAGVIGLGLLTFAAALVTGGNPVAVVAPVAGVTVLWLAWTLPARLTVPAFLFLATVADTPAAAPADGMWHSPLYVLGEVMCTNWSKAFQVPVPASGIDLLVILLVARALVRSRGRVLREMPSALHVVAVTVFGALAWTFAWGLFKGGDASIAYRQVRMIAMAPLFAYVLASGIDSEQDAWRLGRMVVAASAVKLAVGIFFFYGVAVPQGLSPAYITTHSDTVLFVACIALAMARVMLEPGSGQLRRSALLAGYFLFGIWLNNRRLAYVGVVACMLLAFAVTPRGPVKRLVMRAAVLSLPLLVVYAVVGWNRTEGIFKPVVALRTMSDGDADASTHSREVENWNLSRTLTEAPVLGSGLGQPYHVVHNGVGIDLSAIFELWRYLPHNSVLWLFCAGGLLAFVPLWGTLIVTAYLCGRANRFARNARQRVMAALGLCIVMLYVVQAYGDMGTQDWGPALMLGLALAVSARLCTWVGAWPAAREANVSMTSVSMSSEVA